MSKAEPNRESASEWAKAEGPTTAQPPPQPPSDNGRPTRRWAEEDDARKEVPHDEQDSHVENQILLGLILNPDVLAVLAPHWDEKGQGRIGPLASQYANLVGWWCVEHWKKWHAAPGYDITRQFREWAAQKGEEDPEVGLVQKHLLWLNDSEGEFKKTYNTPVLLEVAEKHFSTVDLRKRMDKASVHFKHGRRDKALAEMGEYKPISFKARGDRFPLRTSNSIYSGEGMVGLSYLVDDILVKGQPCIIGGPEKVCKTWLLLDLLHSLHTRTPFLGYFGTNEYARVLMMSGESGQATLERNLLTLNRERSFPGDEGKDPNPGGLYALSNQVIQFTKPEDLAWLDNSFQTYGWQVVMTDTASLAMDFENAGNSGVMQRQLRGVDEVCQRYGATLIIAHHFNKMGGNVYRPGTLNDLSQAGFREWTRQWLLVTRREPYEAPFDKDHEREHRLTLVAGGSAGHSGEYAINCNEGSQNSPRWRVDVRSRGEAKVADQERVGDIRLEEDKQKITRALRKFPEGEVGEVLRVAAGISSSTRFKVVCQTMVAEGTVCETQLLRGNGRKSLGYKWVDSQT